MKTLRIDLTLHGFDGQYVDIKEPKSLSYGETKRLAQLQAKASKLAAFAGSSVNEPGAQMPTETDFAAMDEVMSAVAGFVVGWNLTDADGRELPLPKDNLQALDDVPLVVLQAVMTKITEGINPPKA